MDQKKIGRFLKELRKEKQLTQEALSEILGVSGRSISRWENGVNMPDLDLVIELANYYDVSIDEILDGERNNQMIDKKDEQMILKVADYENNGKERFSRRICALFVLAIVALIVYAVIESKGLASTGVYEKIASGSLGFVSAILVVGVLYTSGYLTKIKALKRRILGKSK